MGCCAKCVYLDVVSVKAIPQCGWRKRDERLQKQLSKWMQVISAIPVNQVNLENDCDKYEEKQ